MVDLIQRYMKAIQPLIVAVVGVVAVQVPAISGYLTEANIAVIMGLIGSIAVAAVRNK